MLLITQQVSYARESTDIRSEELCAGARFRARRCNGGRGTTPPSALSSLARQRLRGANAVLGESAECIRPSETRIGWLQEHCHAGAPLFIRYGSPRQ